MHKGQRPQELFASTPLRRQPLRQRSRQSPESPPSRLYVSLSLLLRRAVVCVLPFPTPRYTLTAPAAFVHISSTLSARPSPATGKALPAPVCVWLFSTREEPRAVSFRRSREERGPGAGRRDKEPQNRRDPSTKNAQKWKSAPLRLMSFTMVRKPKPIGDTETRPLSLWRESPWSRHKGHTLFLKRQQASEWDACTLPEALLRYDRLKPLHSYLPSTNARLRL